MEKALDERTSRGIVGNLDEHFRYKAAESLDQPGSAAGQAMGMGMGAGMGMAMGGMGGPWGARPQAPAAAPVPPPPPVEHVWHVAKDGQTSGPFSRATMGQMASTGQLTRESWVWTQGQDGWMKAEDVAELAQLFTVLPPPPPEN